MIIEYDIPNGNSIETVSDWVELSVTLTGDEISKTEVAAAIRSSLGDEPSGAFISDVWAELKRRLELYGSRPPYEVNELEVLPLTSFAANPAYVFCLVLSLEGNPVQPTVTGKLFERLCNEALKSYLGGETLTFGYPGTITVQHLCQLTGEQFKRELPAAANDRGLDVVGWKPLDSRGNQIIVFMQCAGGKNWRSKTTDVVMRAWTEKYVGFHVKPTRAFATPISITNLDVFEEVSFETDLLFDRPRIYNNTVTLVPTASLAVEISDWCQERLADLLY